MKYITKEIWSGWNSKDEKLKKQAFEESERSLKLYAEDLEKLRSQLGENNFNFFKEGLHDGRIISFNVGEGIDLDYEREGAFTIAEFSETKVKIEVLEAYFEEIYSLKYEQIQKVVFDFPSDKPLWGYSIGDWGYDEISAIENGYFRHEILFSSGAIILIEFQNFSFQIRQCKRSHHPKRP
jgi:hypothetical protein